MNRKDIISTIYITILTAAALVYGFMSIPSPAQQHEISLDHRRVSDLGEIKQTIEQYYQTNNHLPVSLDELKTNAYTSTEPLNKKDPQTNAPYEYKILHEVPPDIQLCATFTTDSSKDDPTASDNANYAYSSFSGNYQHPKGHYCFKLNIAYYSPTPTMNEVPTTPTPYLPKHPFSEYPPKK